jgi:hypothetical protein
VPAAHCERVVFDANFLNAGVTGGRSVGLLRRGRKFVL